MTPSRTQVWSACLGNLFEHYDTALFGFLSVFLAPIMFPEKDQITALIWTYALIPLGMLARPLGSVVFGWIGDVYGRKEALFLSMAGMSMICAGIALSPTYVQAGMIAPVFFCIGRIIQNFLSAGETMGGAVFLLEHSNERNHDLLSGIYSASAMGGHLLACFGVSILCTYQMVDSGWRWLYLFGCLTGVFGCVIRSQVHSDEVWGKRQGHVSPISNLRTTLWACRKPLLWIILCSGFGYANYSIALVFMNGFVPLVSSLTKEQMMGINTSLLILDFCALPFFGWLASRISREVLMLSSSLTVALCGIPFFMLLKDASQTGVVGIRSCFVLLGVAFFAPFHAWAQQLIPPAHRYAVISFGYALGSQAIGGPTAALCLWCFKKTGMVSSACWYWVALATASSLIIATTLRIPKWTKISN